MILGNGTIINGSGAPHLTVSGNDQFRVFFVGDTTDTVSATIENLTISHALAKGGDGGAGSGGGGSGAGLGPLGQVAKKTLPPLRPCHQGEMSTSSFSASYRCRRRRRRQGRHHHRDGARPHFFRRGASRPSPTSTRRPRRAQAGNFLSPVNCAWMPPACSSPGAPSARCSNRQAFVPLLKPVVQTGKPLLISCTPMALCSPASENLHTSRRGEAALAAAESSLPWRQTWVWAQIRYLSYFRLS